jgi:hypothetical protein
MKPAPAPTIYGMMAEFEGPADLLAAAREARAQGYRRMDAFTPFPMEAIAEALGFRTVLPYLVLLGGIVGGLAGYFLQYWTSVIAYPLNIGGKPLHSWTAFIPVTFECTILGAALTAVFGMLAINGLPEPYHPVFHNPRFVLASRDRFFLCIEARDPKYDKAETRKFLEGLRAKEVVEVAN